MSVVRIPHRAPVRFLDETCLRVGEWLLVAARVPAGSPAAVDGAVGPGWLIEIAAQAAAAWPGDDAGGDSAAGGGRLVAVKEWRWLAPAPLATALAVRVRCSGALGDLAQFECEIAVAGKPLAAGVLTVARAP